MALQTDIVRAGETLQIIVTLVLKTDVCIVMLKLCTLLFVPSLQIASLQVMLCAAVHCRHQDELWREWHVHGCVQTVVLP
jgi:hypothetical protein